MSRRKTTAWVRFRGIVTAIRGIVTAMCLAFIVLKSLAGFESRQVPPQFTKIEFRVLGANIGNKNKRKHHHDGQGECR